MTKSKKMIRPELNPAKTTESGNRIKRSASVQTRNTVTGKKFGPDTETGNRDEKKNNYKSESQWKIIK
jgi:hypothetical protein